MEKSKFLEWLEQATEKSKTMKHNWVDSILVSPDIQVEVRTNKNYPDEPIIELWVKDSLSIMFGDYVYSMSHLSMLEVEELVKRIYDEAQKVGIDETIKNNIQLFI